MQWMNCKLAISSKDEGVHSLKLSSSFPSRETLPRVPKEIWPRRSDSTAWEREEMEIIEVSINWRINNLCDIVIKWNVTKITQPRQTNRAADRIVWMKLTNVMLKKTAIWKVISMIYHEHKVKNSAESKGILFIYKYKCRNIRKPNCKWHALN